MSWNVRICAAEILVLFVSLAVYLALAVWMTRNWKPLGDEPHYLLAAHSLVYDHDLDLANNYEQKDYRRFLDAETLDRHVKVLPDARQVLSHDPGLVLFIALPYALGGRAGVEFAFACVGALLAVQIFALARELTQSTPVALLTWIALAFTPPLLLYAALVYPELPGALILIWTARTILLKPDDWSRVRIAAVAFSIAVLPWLSMRFMIVLALLIFYVLVRRLRSRVALTVLILGALSVASYYVLTFIFLAGREPVGITEEISGAGLAALTFTSVSRGLVGWWIDPQRGTLILAPVYVLALAGVPRLLRLHPFTGSGLMLPLLLTNGLIAILGGFWIAYEVGARYLVIGLPLLAAPLALALQAGFGRVVSRTRAVAFGGFALLLCALSYVNGWLMIADPPLGFGSVVSTYSRALGRDLSPLFAPMGHAVQIAPQSSDLTNVVTINGERFWHVAKGASGSVIQSGDIIELTNGNYDLTFQALVLGAQPEYEVLRLDLFSSEGLSLVQASWRGVELEQRDSPRAVAVNFDNPYFNRWGYPLSLQITSTGEGEVWISAVTFDPDTSVTWLRIGFWSAIVLAVVLVLNLDLVGAPRPLREHVPLGARPLPSDSG